MAVGCIGINSPELDGEYMVGTQGDSPDEFVRYKPIRIGSQSGRGVVLTIHRDDVVTELFGSQSQSGRGVVLTDTLGW